MSDKNSAGKLDSLWDSFEDLSKEYFSEASHEMVHTAFSLAEEKLRGLNRYDGSPFFSHSVNVSRIVMKEIGLGRNSVISTLLHDVVRLKLMEHEEVERRFGGSCVRILKGLCNISDVDTKESKAQVDNFRELIISYSTDPRVILIKLADRLEVMRVLDIFPAKKRTKKAWESLNLYAQIAHKLGLYNVKSELEDCSLKYLESEDYQHINRRLEESASEREEFIRTFVKPIEEKMEQQGFCYTLKSRTKSTYSIWRKMKRTHISFEEVYDLFAIRIVVDCPKEQEKALCWNVYSIVTDFYTPNPERMRDWISIPKSNGYESLHTTVVTDTGRWVEIQIRTERMDEVAERGVAAHWRYKGLKGDGIGMEEWMSILRNLMETANVQEEVAEQFDTKLTSSEIFVFTPTGDLCKLRKGATVLDFAFEIHTNLGSTCIGGKVNHKNVSIKEPLKNGDIVEILSAKNQKPKADWLTYAITSKARNSIKTYLREEQAKSMLLIREELERKVKNWKLSVSLDEAISVACKHFKLKSGIELYQQIEQQNITFMQLKELLQRYLSAEVKEDKIVTKAEIGRKETEDSNALIIDEVLTGVEYKLGRCCNPIFGDDVFGFTTISSGITIHRRDCPNAKRLLERYPYRVLPARWQQGTSLGLFRATIRVQAENEVGLLNKVTEVISNDLKLNIHSMNLSSDQGIFSGLINLTVPNNKTIDAVIHSLLKINGMRKVYRVNK